MTRDESRFQEEERMALLLELVQKAVTPDLTRRISVVVTETPAATEAAMRRAMPAVLAGVINTAVTTAGAERLIALIREGGWGAEALASLGTRLAGGSGTTALVSSGARLVSEIFGSTADSLADLIASGGGVQRRAGSTMLSLLAPIVMSVVGKQIDSRGLGPVAVSTMLTAERATVRGALPPGVAGLLGMKDVLPRISTATDTPTGVRWSIGRERRVSDVVKRWWPALLVGLAALPMLFSLTQRDVALRPMGVPAMSPRQTTSITLPDGARVNVDHGGSVQQLSSYLADRWSADAAPKRFVFDDLNFETGSTRLRDESQSTVHALLAVLKAYPS
jgi:OmpA-OmpF porin, OOP family